MPEEERPRRRREEGERLVQQLGELVALEFQHRIVTVAR